MSESKVGQRLRYLRECNNIMSKDLAKILNVEPATLTNWEKGNRFPKDEVLMKICDYFDCSMDYLFGRTDNPNIKILQTDYKGHEVEVAVDKNFTGGLTAEEFEKLLTELKEHYIDVDKIMEKIKDTK